MNNTPARIGYTYNFNSKQGGGSYTVVGHINCERCNTICEDREWTSPSRKHRQRGKYYSHYYWCPECGLYKPDEKSQEILLTNNY